MYKSPRPENDEPDAIPQVSYPTRKRRANAAPSSGERPVMRYNGGEPITRRASLVRDQQVQQLMDNKWYVNVHTKANPGGELRGQLTQGGM